MGLKADTSLTSTPVVGIGEHLQTASAHPLSTSQCFGVPVSSVFRVVLLPPFYRVISGTVSSHLTKKSYAVHTQLRTLPGRHGTCNKRRQPALLVVKNIFWTILYAIALQTCIVPSLASLVHYWLVKRK